MEGGAVRRDKEKGKVEEEGVKKGRGERIEDVKKIEG